MEGTNPAAALPRRIATFLVAGALALGGFMTSPAPTALADEPAFSEEAWFTSWAQSQQRISGKAFGNQSIRMVTKLTQGGDGVRIRLQNQFGTAPVSLDQTPSPSARAGPGSGHRPIAC